MPFSPRYTRNAVHPYVSLTIFIRFPYVSLTIFIHFLYDFHTFPLLHPQVHPKYIQADFQNDIALLRTTADIVYREHVVPVCLPALGATFVGQRGTVTGWGRQQHGEGQGGRCANCTLLLNCLLHITSELFIAHYF